MQRSKRKSAIWKGSNIWSTKALVIGLSLQIHPSKFGPPSLRNMHAEEGTSLAQSKLAEVNLVIEGDKVLKHHFRIPNHGRCLKLVYSRPLYRNSVSTVRRTICEQISFPRHVCMPGGTNLTWNVYILSGQEWVTRGKCSGNRRKGTNANRLSYVVWRSLFKVAVRHLTHSFLQAPP